MPNPHGLVEVEVCDYLTRKFCIHSSPSFAGGISGAAFVANSEQTADQGVEAISGVSRRTWRAIRESFSCREQQELWGKHFVAQR